MNLTKVVKYLCFQNYKTLMRELEYDRKKQKDIPCSWIVWINIFKMSTLPVRRCSVIPNNRLKIFFTELE